MFEHTFENHFTQPTEWVDENGVPVAFVSVSVEELFDEYPESLTGEERFRFDLLPDQRSVRVSAPSLDLTNKPDRKVVKDMFLEGLSNIESRGFLTFEDAELQDADMFREQVGFTSNKNARKP